MPLVPVFTGMIFALGAGMTEPSIKPRFSFLRVLVMWITGIRRRHVQRELPL
jgi:hypothetical protein